MVKNKCIDTIAENAKFSNDISLINELDSSNDDFEERSFVGDHLWREIYNLPPNCREIFLMNKRDGMKYSEIAEELNISVKTVESHISKALKRLKEKAIKIYTFIFL